MKHARKDYDRIQDPHNWIPEDEPVFLIRAQDAIAPDVLDYYAATLQLRFNAFPGIDNIVKIVLHHAEEMRTWQKTVKVKIPDIPDELDESTYNNRGEGGLGYKEGK